MRPNMRQNDAGTMTYGSAPIPAGRNVRTTLCAAMTVLAVLLLTHPTAQAQDAHTVSSLGEPRFPMLEFVNLNAELGLEASGLRGFGLRVDEARRRADAGAVAALAVLLSYYEDLAGAAASTVTAAGLLEEAARIADEQQNTDAAAAIAAASRRVPGTEEIVRNLDASLAMLARTRGDGDFIGYVRVVNEYDRVLDVYIDGQYSGFLFGGEAGVYSTGNGSTQIRVTDAFGNTAVELLSVRAEETVTWTLKP